MDCIKNGTPMFDGQNYALWSRRMKTFLQAQGFDVWQAVVNRYKAPTSHPTDKDENKLSGNNSKDTKYILSVLVNLVYVKVMHFDSTKKIWDKL
jgi:hypothetical protein